MIKISKYLFAILTCFTFMNTGHAQLTIYTPKGAFNEGGFNFDNVFFHEGKKTSNKEFDKRMKAQVNTLNSYYSNKLNAKQNLSNQLQVECNYLADIGTLLAVYMSRYPKILQQPEAKALFLQSRKYHDHFAANNSKCGT